MGRQPYSGQTCTREDKAVENFHWNSLCNKQTQKKLTNKQTNLLSIRSKLPLCLNIVMQHMVTHQFERRHIVLFERGQLNTETFRIL